ncbi:HEAT repeat domain-containing protein [Cyclobacterium plantarum]|uniref:HEAT repeat domain-containing protein n=1 Tax=Cyclobacterium plantarum TaxID=2716263 RepID=A0ABX0H1B6_9BACT|nr:HEAT repeat domain-containing protein [Cyclobacterium plantarum]NHE55575.1 HEAT repeat domain-containing protein [Cyclobacterium plantarum]
MTEETEQKINGLLEKMLDKDQEEPLKYGEHLARMGNPEVRQKLIQVMNEGDMDEAFLAAKTLSMIPEERDKSLDALLVVIHKPTNHAHNGGLVSLLEEFDLSQKFVDLFRIYLFGNFKAAALAKVHLDYTEFDISPRTLKKAEKHWRHFLNNASHDEAFELKKEEAETILKELEDLLSD